MARIGCIQNLSKAMLISAKGENIMTKPLKKLPGVLSFQRCLLVTDALFFNLFPDGVTSPLPVVRHGIRGTQNINKTGKKEVSSAGSVVRGEVSNIQTTDSAKLDPGAEKLRVRFEVRFLDISAALFACAPGKTDSSDDLLAFREGLNRFIEKGKQSTGLEEVACRYARNLANGRFLWRNRAVAEHVLVRVKDKSGLNVCFDALQVPLNTFAEYSDDEKAVAGRILEGLRGRRDTSLLVEADVDFGVRGALEVFPSQNYLEDKARGFARPLYCVGEAPANQDRHSVQERGQAALRDQKVGNAIRTIDTWYPEYAGRGLPIPVEPNGASLDAQLFFRGEKDTSGFTYMLRVADMAPDTPEGMFLLACIIRGGVFSESA